MKEEILSRLRAFLKNNGITQRELAKMVNIDERTLNRKLKGDRGLDLDELSLLATALPSLSMDYLIRGEEQNDASDEKLRIENELLKSLIVEIKTK